MKAASGESHGAARAAHVDHPVADNASPDSKPSTPSDVVIETNNVSMSVECAKGWTEPPSRVQVRMKVTMQLHS